MQTSVFKTCVIPPLKKQYRASSGLSHDPFLKTKITRVSEVGRSERDLIEFYDNVRLVFPA